MSKQYYFKQYAKTFLEKERSTVYVKQGAPVRFALVYPNSYQVGMASLGFQTVYRILNQHPMIRCERVFVYDSPFDQDIRTLESGQRIDQFDIIGFSLSFEKDIINVIRILNSLPSPLLFQHRSDADPVILTGGVVSGLNPSPLLPFIDGLLVGEGEGVLNEIADILYRCHETKKSRKQKLEHLSKVKGVFIHGISEKAARHIQNPLGAHPAFTPVITPLSHFREMFVIEAARGCSRSCRFCAARQIYHPFRSFSDESILETIRKHNQRAKKIGLEGAGLSDYGNLEKLCARLIKENYQVSFSSIRADRISKKLVEILNKGGVRSFTIAPETGSEQLRKRIGKGVSDETLFQAVTLLGQSHISTLKLYYLIGCPGETKTDIDALINMTRDLADIFKRNPGRKELRVSVNAFIPKPFTAFQWAPMNSEKELNEKRKMIREALKREKGITLVSKSSRDEILQGVLSLGNEQVGLALRNAVENNISWKEAFKRNDVDVQHLLHREKSFHEKLPWDYITYPVDKAILWKQYRHSQSGNR